MPPSPNPLSLAPLLNPLRFAARRDFANLDTIRDLEGTLRRGLDAVRAQAGPSSEVVQRLDALAPLLAQVAEDDPTARRDAVRTLLTRLEALDAAAGPRSSSRDGDGRGSGAPKRAARAPGADGDSRPRAASARGASRQRSAGRVAAATKAAEVHDGGDAAQSPRLGAAAWVGAAPRTGVRPTGRRIKMADAAPSTPLSEVVGVGPKTAERFAAKGFETVQDLMFFVPRQYEDRSQFTAVAALVPGESATIKGEVLAARVRPAGRGKRVLEVAVSDGTATVSCRFFRFPGRMEAQFPRGTEVTVSGSVTAWGAQRQFVHPDLEKITDAAPTPQGILPVYGDVEGVPPKTVRRIVQGLAAACGGQVPDILPDAMRAEYNLPRLSSAVVDVHLPAEARGATAVEAMRARLVFDELLLLQLALDRTRRGREAEPGLVHRPAKSGASLAQELLPFTMTAAQSRALGEVVAELEAPQPMNRLLQGDVGSGKTAVALVASAVVCSAGRQAAILAPTEILADQHFAGAQKILAPAGMTVARLTGSARPKERRQLLRALADQQVDVLVGTHALLEPDVVFKDLGLAVVDEQHRFGVHQRAALRNKRANVMPDVLLMTATPIPRTLALTAYGDLRVSVIDELPPGRQPTVTEVFTQSTVDRAYEHIAAALTAGRQAYIVYPLVEASDKLDLEAATEAVGTLTERFAPHQVGLLHGQMRPDEKASVMQRFKAADIGVLISTTVVEVGVDVPNATVMMVQHADRFGLSQLHQLRGRVGRGEHRGACLLVAGDASADGRARLEILAETSDGFVVAERDLALRGPGELLGTRQSGLPDLLVTNLARDGRIVETTRQACDILMRTDPDLADPAHAALKQELERRYANRLKLAAAG